jgi:hypothetical protein
MMRVEIVRPVDPVSIGKTPQQKARQPAFLGQGRVVSCLRLELLQECSRRKKHFPRGDLKYASRQNR